MTHAEAIAVLMEHFKTDTALDALEKAQKTWPDGMPDHVSTAYVVAFDGFHQLFFGTKEKE